jgi:hypothetical protein
VYCVSRSILFDATLIPNAGYLSQDLCGQEYLSGLLMQDADDDNWTRHIEEEFAPFLSSANDYRVRRNTHETCQQ